jgi:DNA-binding NarL/FixJ family response regulator
VDAHDLARASLRLLLSGEPDLEVVGEASNGQEALELCRGLHPDLVLMDLRMPIIDGIMATRMIQHACPATRILIFTIAANPEQLARAEHAGATGCLLKEASRQELIAAIHQILAGKRLFE